MHIYCLVFVLTVAVAPVSTERNKCPRNKGFVSVGEPNPKFCLRWFEKIATGLEAERTYNGGRLGVFDTEKKCKYLQSTHARNYWVGMNNRNGTFTWLNGKPFNKTMASKDFDPKAKYTAKGRLVSECAIISNKDDLLLNDHCIAKYPFVCEKPEFSDE